MYGTAWRMLQNREEAEDAVQDAFLALHRAGVELDADESAAWLHRTLTNRCIDRLRHRGRWHEEELPEDLPHSGPRALKAEWMDLERAVAKLPPRARLVFLLHDVRRIPPRRSREPAGDQRGRLQVPALPGARPAAPRARGGAGSRLVSCAEFELWVVSDDPAERRQAAEHAAGCPRCAAKAAGFAELARLAGDWRQSPPEPSLDLEARIAATAADRPDSLEGGRRRFFVAVAAAAALMALAGGFLWEMERRGAGPTQTSGSILASRALADAEDAEREHARAIARLEEAARPLLERAGDPALPAKEAAKLLSYRDRLRYLDSTIADVKSYLDENPYQAKARAVLLASYVEKTEILREVVQGSSGGVL